MRPDISLADYATERNPDGFSDDAKTTLCIVATDRNNYYDIHLVSQPHNKHYQNAVHRIPWTPAGGSDKDRFRALLKQYDVTEEKMAAILGYSSTATMHNSNPWKDGTIFTRIFALHAIFSNSDPGVNI